MKKGHLYRITVEYLKDIKGESVEKEPLTFETTNHDEIFQIVERTTKKGLFDADESAAFAVGLKLFSEVMLNNKDNDLFKPLRPAFGEFMQRLKKGNRGK
jgi:hypothetical protein